MARAPVPQINAHTEAIAFVRGAAAGTGQRLVVIAFVDTWSPPALAMAAALEAAKADVRGFASIFLVDATADGAAAHEAGVLSTPAVQFFWDGIQATIHRPAWDDDDKYSGAAPAERIVEMIRHARDCCVKADGMRLVVDLDF